MTRYGGLGRTRPKKLTSKASIPIVREEDIDVLDEDIQSHQQIETGVEKAEESEFHLQVAINLTAQGKVNDAHIPTPETILSNLRYDELYPPLFSQPATYIRSSATVEDCCGCLYNMTEEDDVFLKILNQKRDASNQCSEDNFEATMNFFEETAQAKQPYAAVDSPPVLTFAEMKEAMDAAVEEAVKRFAKEIYPHWTSRRMAEGSNNTLEPSLKFETGQDTDDSDPYVCFRRREVRQIRKTRGRDAQSAEKLRRLRKELEDARQMVALVRQREVARKEMLIMERTLFLQRAEVKEMKRKLNIKDDDEDLVNQKPKKKVEPTTGQRPNPPQLRLPPRAGLQGAEDLQLLEDVQAEKENEILRDIKTNIAKHIKWNEGYVDHTRAPLSPSPERTFDAAAFRPAFTAQLPTPPSSDSSGDMMDTSLDVTSPIFSRDKLKLASRGMVLDEEPNKMPSFRRRVGRGGRLMIDRRNFAARCKIEMDPIKTDRFKFDQEDSDEEPIYELETFNVQIMQHRAMTMAKVREQAAVAAAQAHAQAQAQAAQVQAQRRLQSDQSGNQGAPPAPSAVAAPSEA
ncbi:Enhancer of polycomb-like protein 1 [Penicillium malachiteum]|uniref:Enhancer of polycomb-like protein 1 n=1 Tax=Penicillium malachiteum TaxID=1324776 RepID=UPI002547980E|nr:Enhancer of polycomb-like protein 1 [Penicillium malachiteum]KAJ5715129.1 Enhancer of polycomb-like protein 1 [Penicillium malachiteum]